jgi:hypothetical protein
MGAHNGAVTDGQVGVVCPQCGSAAAVHSIQELAALARGRLGGQPGYAGAPQQGYAAEPQAGPLPGYAQEPQAGPLPGYGATPPSGPVPGGWQGRSRFPSSSSSGDDFSLEGDLADIALNAATKFIGRAIGRRVQRTVTERVMPTLAAKQEAVLREQIAIAERHPDLRACLTDKVVFLAGGSRVLPLEGIGGMLTLEQSDALVARLRDG